MQRDNIPPRRRPVHADVAFVHLLAHLPPPVRPLVRRARKERRPCLLCQGPFSTIGIFVPADPPQWGIAPDMAAACVYGLCRDCVALPDCADRAEAVLWATRHQDLQRARAPWN
jgi:hypothetical protein